MGKVLEVLGNVVALVGVLVCLVSGLSRVIGNSFVGDFEAMTLFGVGVGFMVLACLIKLELLSKRL